MRRFNRNYSVVIYQQTLYDAIVRCKRGADPIWMPVLARILLGFLGANPEMRHFDVIMPAPAYMDMGVATYSHSLTLVRTAAAVAKGEWPFETTGTTPAVKTAPTDRMSDHPSAPERDEVGKQLRKVLRLSPDADVRGQRFLIVDDVFTRGNTLNATAALLKDAGAIEVCGLSMVRKNKQPRSPD